MANEYYNHGTTPITTSNGSSEIIRAELLLVEAGFNKLPPFAGNAGKPVIVNPAGSAMTVEAFTFTLTANLTTSGAFTTNFVNQHSSSNYLPQGNGTLTLDTTFPGFLSGFLMENAADTVNDITVNPGICASNNAGVAIVSMEQTSSRTKQLDASWVTGTNQGGRCSPALANGTWHMFAISVSGVTDFCFDDNPTGTHVAASTGATTWRRIGSFVRASATIVQFDQFNNQFLLDVSTTDVSTNNPGTAAVTAVLASIPTGIELDARVVAKISDVTAAVAVAMLVTPLIVTDTVPTTNNGQLISDAAGGAAMNASIMLEVYTDTSSSIRYRLSSSNTDITAEIVSIGWMDYRGQYGGL